MLYLLVLSCRNIKVERDYVVRDAKVIIFIEIQTLLRKFGLWTLHGKIRESDHPSPEYDIYF